MVKSVAGVIIGLWAVLAVGVGVAPLLSSAGAESNRLPPQLLTATTAPTVPTTIPAVTTATTAPDTSTRKPKTTVTRPRGSTTTIVPPSTTTVPPTTVGPIPTAVPPPVTLPLATTVQSGHVSVVFPILGGLGLVSLIGLLVAQWQLTKPGRRGPTL